MKRITLQSASNVAPNSPAIETVNAPEKLQAAELRSTGTAALVRGAGWQFRATALPAVAATAPPASPRALLCALRRRWPLAAGGGLVFGVLAAVGAWYL